MQIEEYAALERHLLKKFPAGTDFVILDNNAKLSLLRGLNPFATL